MLPFAGLVDSSQIASRRGRHVAAKWQIEKLVRAGCSVVDNRVTSTSRERYQVTDESKTMGM